ncbi:L,D-transpeptidase [Sphingomonas lenta]|uniref:L,D-transpeptidase n=2 Tax=Sphingomonas lenta TaxID=1141887 RepID=A0A2A2SFD3_9SPHN|nr:L,D-transpeptidase [Sphingomonas lenta]
MRIVALVVLSAALAVIGWAVAAPYLSGAPAIVDAKPVLAAAPAKRAPPAVEPAPPRPEPTLVVKRILDIPAGIGFGEWVWNEEGAPPGGRVVMTVDLKAQTISVFRGGHEIGTAAVLYGADDKPTPLGRYPILEKDRDHVSNLYGAPMPYMLRLTMDGVAIHGSDVKYGMATHGCIGVPTPFAAKLFEAVGKSDLVIVTQGKLLKLGDRIA